MVRPTFLCSVILSFVALVACTQSEPTGSAATPVETASSPEPIPTTLECGPGSLAADSILDYSGYRHGDKGSPEEIARDEMRGLRPGDEVLSYEGVEPPELAVRRDEAVIAIIRFTPTDDGGLVIGSFEACDDSGIRYDPLRD